MTDEKRPDADTQLPAEDTEQRADDQVSLAEETTSAPESLPETQPEAEARTAAETDAEAKTETSVESESAVASQSGEEPSTSESQPEQAADVADEHTPLQVAPVKPKGRLLAALAFLLALSGVAGVGYLYYELVYLQPLVDVRARSAQLAADYTQLQSGIQSQLDELSRSTKAAIDAAAQEQAQKLAENETAVLKSLNEALSAAPPSQREWKLAEAEYLLRIANHRVLMEQDSAGALNLLQAADQIMAELDDFALHQVRAQLADEIIALRQVRRDDLQGIYLRLESIKSQLDNLPLPQPEYLETQAPATESVSIWSQLLDELKQFVRVRSLQSQEALQPLLAPEEAQYLQLNLRLAVEQAQLAALKRQQDVFEQSLLNVRRWLVEHADVEDGRTKAILESVDELLLLELARPLPEISGSLTELLSIRRSET